MRLVWGGVCVCVCVCVHTAVAPRSQGAPSFTCCATRIVLFAAAMMQLCGSHRPSLRRVRCPGTVGLVCWVCTVCFLALPLPLKNNKVKREKRREGGERERERERERWRGVSFVCNRCHITTCSNERTLGVQCLTHGGFRRGCSVRTSKNRKKKRRINQRSVREK